MIFLLFGAGQVVLLSTILVPKGSYNQRLVNTTSAITGANLHHMLVFHILGSYYLVSFGYAVDHSAHTSVLQQVEHTNSEGHRYNVDQPQ